MYIARDIATLPSFSRYFRSYTEGIGYERRADDAKKERPIKDREQVEIFLEEESALACELAVEQEDEMQGEGPSEPDSERLSAKAAGAQAESSLSSTGACDEKIEEVASENSVGQESAELRTRNVEVAAQSAQGLSTAAPVLPSAEYSPNAAISMTVSNAAPGNIVAALPALAAPAVASVQTAQLSDSSAISEAASAMAALSSFSVHEASTTGHEASSSLTSTEAMTDTTLPSRAPIEAGTWLGHIMNGQWQIREHYITPALKYVLRGLEESGHVDRIEMEGPGGRMKTYWIAANR